MSGHVVQVIQRLIPGGIETLALDLSERLPGDNRVLSLEWSREQIIGNWPALAESPVPFEGLEKPPGIRPGFIFTLARRLRELAPRAVLAHHVGPLLYGGLAARLAGVPRFVYVEHDVWHYQDAGDRRLARLAAHLVRPRVVAVSHNVAQTVREVMPGCPVEVIPNAVDTNRFVPGDRAAARARLGLPQDARIVGAAGRLEAVKGQDVLVAAMAGVPDAMLVLIGKGSQMEALQAQTARLGLSDRVRFLGHRSDMPSLYPAFDLVSLPSRNEGLPLSVLEAQACGIPVVATDVGSVREGICPDTGMVVPPEDPPAMAAAITRMLAQPGTGDPRAFVLSHYSWARMLASYEALLGAAS
ncbi:glycosyltransferase [Aquabacter cavernae]|uniref:glycosyltransferase n=1 Tax=Aquabacter cavernae TaxID=2496029 RepID=UPI00196B8574|nr:glycosyltransferase [Aquabacter cavernae]